MSSRREFIENSLIGAGGMLFFLKSDALGKAVNAIENAGKSKVRLPLTEDENFWSQIQSAFDLDRSIIHLNSGGVSASPGDVHAAYKRYLDYSNQAPSYYMWRHIEPHIELVREKLSKVYGCDKEEIAITRNASESLEAIQFGMELKPGDEVIATTQAYGRMLTTWEQRVRRDGIVLKKVVIPTPLFNKEDYIESIREAITGKTKAIMVMHVINITGQITPVLDISRMAHEKGIPVICDGAHSFNHFPFTQKELECDFFGTSLHKWTYAPVGTGMLFIKKEWIPKIWSLMAAPEVMDNDIRKFEEIGTHPAASHNAIAEALAFNEIISVERKAKRLRYLHHLWVDRLKKYDNVKFMVNVEDDSQWCGIMTVDIDGVDVAKLANYLLKEHHIYLIPIVHDEFKCIRVTPNVYSLKSEIDYFGDVMESVARGEVDEVMAN
ncbi:MAG: aminotransferase class V-fold PLP-dependent enzyme [Melioribacteraceae bacterium]|nr:aminotransferase class V-fold PLP-dependent enzyme [Melioribacteraceae bacterium]MCF8353877.1 aminotransferase class V-fold PLP-dependent enzyme [Melioribacteraceae bacterium]MCF8393110.1 aminotransferase class V-fold PLP-dependent enzyme [Melioribacteraceae bacterium]MCF8419229.1 aminotransferase class V-fold PLP-dependent enzyme [Melioribacteraceae bacterium]